MNRSQHRKSIIVLLLVLAVAGMARAQSSKTWPMPGAEWTYCLYANGDAYAKEVWRVTSDSLIGNRIYDVIQPVDSLGHPIPNFGKMLLTRCENNTVYRYVNNKEYLYFPLDLNEGNVFTTFRSAGWGVNGTLNYGNDSTCSSLKPLLVAGKKEVELGVLVLNEYTLKDTLFKSLYDYDEGLEYWRMVDRIGPIDTYPLIDINEGGFYNGYCIYSFVSESNVYLSAYRDDSFEYVWFECKPTGVAENTKDHSFEVYPNPTTGIVRIESEEVVEIQVYNSFGSLVMTFRDMNEINLDVLPKGLYMLIITDPKNNRGTTKVILE